MRATLVNILTEIPGVHFYATSSVHWTECPPPKVRSPLAMYHYFLLSAHLISYSFVSSWMSLPATSTCPLSPKIKIISCSFEQQGTAMRHLDCVFTQLRFWLSHVLSPWFQADGSNSVTPEDYQEKENEHSAPTNHIGLLWMSDEITFVNIYSVCGTDEGPNKWLLVLLWLPDTTDHWDKCW